MTRFCLAFSSVHVHSSILQWNQSPSMLITSPLSTWRQRVDTLSCNQFTCSMEHDQTWSFNSNRYCCPSAVKEWITSRIRNRMVYKQFLDATNRLSLQKKTLRQRLAANFGKNRKEIFWLPTLIFNITALTDWLLSSRSQCMIFSFNFFIPFY